ncbi:hypothetical protein CD006_01170 [Enterobacter sp. 10-1]|uniref:hypothetical protein n=1 Tax=Raoultella sp. 10-1 TaxID=2683201 RepID=UPI000BA2CBD6|nr:MULTISPECIES: hypothetical protein [Enterobacteriaceae]MVT01299.1 hypothetical protein [Raoultella sp. 10-1]PAC13854.1 hypothetical protein CD006_01170 [Enterobacter sp. 10-1]
MTSKLTREWLQHQISAIEAVGITDSNTLLAFKLALAAMDSEPVYQVFEPSDGRWMDVNDEEEMIRLRSIGGETRTLYTAPPTPVADSKQVTYDNIKAIELAVKSLEDTIKRANRFRYCLGALMNLYEEVALLKNRMGIVGEPVDITDDMAHAFHHALTDSMIGADDVEEIKTGLRVVFANLTAPIVSAKYPERLPCSVLLEPGLRFGKGIKTSTVLAVAMINAARDITVAKINAKGAKFDGYVNHVNWFDRSMKEVSEAVKAVIPNVEREVK